LAMDMLEPVIIVGGVQCFSILHCRTPLLRHAVSKYLETGCEYQNWVQKLNG
jgi:hypothetical protein